MTKKRKSDQGKFTKSPEEVKKFVAKREERKHNIINAAKMTDDDYKYLGGLFEGLCMKYDQMEIRDAQPRAKKRLPGPKLRYTPRQMYDSCAQYIKITIEAQQPLTASGMALFLGINRRGLFDVLHKTRRKEFPEYAFVYDFAAFIEMYNEYAAHRKQNPAGPIFIMKNFGWKDKMEIEATATEGALTDEERAEAQKRIKNFSE